MNTMQKFTQRINRLHEKSKMSQQEIVKAIKQATGEDISQSTYSNWLNGKKEPTLSNLAALASWYGVSVDYLAGFSDDETPANELHNRIEHMTLPPDVSGAAQKLAHLSSASRDKIIADIEERNHHEERFAELETLIRQMDTNGAIASQLIERVNQFLGSDDATANEPSGELVG